MTLSGPLNPREKGVYTTVAPLLSRSVARPRGHRAEKKLWYKPFPWENKGKGFVTIGPETRVYTIEVSDVEKKRKGSTVVVYAFLPCELVGCYTLSASPP